MRGGRAGAIMLIKQTIAAFLLSAGVGLVGLAFAPPVRAEDFYAGKKIDLYIGFGPGGGYDLYGRLLARHLGAHIPGNPIIVPRNMPGAGGLAVINYMVNVAPKDGTAMAIAADGMVVEQLLAQTGINYDASNLNWIGRLLPSTEVYVTWHTSPTKTFEDARRRETILPSSGGGITVYLPRALNLYAGTKFKLVTGYQSSVEQALAMERGEVEGAVIMDRPQESTWRLADREKGLCAVYRLWRTFTGLPGCTDRYRNRNDRR